MQCHPEQDVQIHNHDFQDKIVWYYAHSYLIAYSHNLVRIYKSQGIFAIEWFRDQQCISNPMLSLIIEETPGALFIIKEESTIVAIIGNENIEANTR